MPFPLRPLQVQALAHYMANPRTADISDPGTGKTAPACVYAQYLHETFGAKTIWAMPKSLLRKNKKEMLAFTDLTDRQIVIVDGTPAQRMKQLGDKAGVVFLMGYRRFVDDWEMILQMHPEINCLMADEIHMGGFKNPTNRGCGQLFKAMRKIKYFLAMSGTLIDGRLDSCYSTIHIIEPRYYANHYSFLAQHCLKDDYGNVIGWLNHEKLGRIFLRHCFRKTFEEVYGKEAKVLLKEVVQMDDKTRKAYKEFEELATLELDAVIAAELNNESGFLEGVNPAVNAMRCRQIMQHPHHFGLLKEDELTGKEEAIQIHVEDHLNSKKPLVIFSAFVPEQVRLVKLLTSWGLRVGLINGTVSGTQRSKIDEDFQAGRLDAVVASPATASVGFNWGHCDHVIFASLDYQDVNFVQAYRRMIRGVRSTALRITVLEYEDSVDNRVFRIVDTKSRNKSKVDSTYEQLNLAAL